MVTRVLRVAVLVAALAPFACVQGDIEDDLALLELDRDYFRCSVEPVLVKRCAFAACHGTDERPFRLYAPHRLRLNASAASPMTEEERQANYDQSVGLAGGGDIPQLLLLKALDARSGGYFHRGDDLYGGGDVFQSIDDPGFRAIEAWTLAGAAAPTDCTPAPEVGQ